MESLYFYGNHSVIVKHSVDKIFPKDTFTFWFCGLTAKRTNNFIFKWRIARNWLFLSYEQSNVVIKYSKHILPTDRKFV